MLLSLGAIDFGILVDGAIVMMETILKKRERHPDEILTEDSILRRTTEVARPIFFSTLIIITAYLPLFAFEHIEKKFFTPMAYTVGYALLGALAVALFLIPGLAFYAYYKPRKIYHNRWLERLGDIYHKQIVALLDHPKRVLLPLCIILVMAGVLSYTVSFSQPIIDMVMDQIAGAHSDLAIKIYGDDITDTRHIADKVVNVLPPLYYLLMQRIRLPDKKYPMFYIFYLGGKRF